MICRNCGLQNPAGFGYCGSCGQPLDVAADSPATSFDETIATPTAAPRAAQRSRAQAVPVLPSMSPATGTRRDSIVCRNCGRANLASRSVCYQCGRRLVLPPELRVQRQRRDGERGGRFLGVGASVVALLLAVSAGGLLVGVVLLGGVPQPTAAPIGFMSPAISAPASPAVSVPTASPTNPPTAPPTQAPTAHAPTAPPSAMPTVLLAPTDAPAVATTSPSPVETTAVATDCNNSSVETEWLNLTRDDARQRVPAQEAWCLHQAYVVPYHGSGRIRLLMDGETVFEVDHQASSDQSEYAVPFTVPLLVPPDAVLAYRYRCSSADCAAAIQIGYDAIPAP
jgi:hypothetical protein